MSAIAKNIQRCLFTSWILTLIISTCILIVNRVFFHYTGYNYFPNITWWLIAFLLIIFVGIKIYFNYLTHFECIIKELITYIAVLCAITLLTNAVQLTPFKPIDAKIVHFESYFHIHIGDIVSWSAKHPSLHQFLYSVYGTLAMQMGYIPLIIILTGRFIYAKEYFCLLLISALLGFSFYYFFPTTAPASIIQSAYFLAEQHITGIKFNQIHHYLVVNNGSGGLIAFPSFHVIWAWYCVYITRCWPLVFISLLLFNLVLTASCVLLGWHYISDILGSLILILFTQYSYYWVTRGKLRGNPFRDPAGV